VPAGERRGHRTIGGPNKWFKDEVVPMQVLAVSARSAGTIDAKTPGNWGGKGYACQKKKSIGWGEGNKLYQSSRS